MDDLLLELEGKISLNLKGIVANACQKQPVTLPFFEFTDYQAQLS